MYAGHRESFDHDHVLSDLAQRYDAVLSAIEDTDGCFTNRVVPAKVVLGELGGIESGVRQLIRKLPLEVTEVLLPSGLRLRVPTFDEILRIKGYLVVRRNQTRDYLDVVALSQTGGLGRAASVLARIDDFYEDQRGQATAGVATQLARQLGDPRPRDTRTTKQLRSYKGLDARWADWSTVVGACRDIAIAMVGQ